MLKYYLILGFTTIIFFDSLQKNEAIMVKSLKDVKKNIAFLNAKWLKRPQKSTKPKARKTTEWNKFSPPRHRFLQNPFEN
jgi:hypothetical protein